MNNTSGGLLQKSLSKVFQNSLAAQAAEVLLLLLIGAIAITLHARMRIPLHIPGRQGLIFMAVIIAGKSFSRYPFAASVSCLGSSSLLMMNILGYDDPFMPVVYASLGVIIDSMFFLFSRLGKSPWILAFAGGISWATIPLIRLVTSMITGFPYHSLMAGLWLPLSSHFIAGFLGCFIALVSIRIVTKNTE